jgi:cell division protease FtsH
VELLITNETVTSEQFAPLLGKRSEESKPVAA